jgi:hypothetical protein
MAEPGKVGDYQPVSLSKLRDQPIKIIAVAGAPVKEYERGRVLTAFGSVISISYAHLFRCVAVAVDGLGRRRPDALGQPVRLGVERADDVRCQKQHKIGEGDAPQ